MNYYKSCKSICIYIQSHNILNKQSCSDFFWHAIILSNICANLIDLEYVTFLNGEYFSLCWLM